MREYRKVFFIICMRVKLSQIYEGIASEIIFLIEIPTCKEFLCSYIVDSNFFHMGNKEISICVRPYDTVNCVLLYSIV